MATAPPLKPPGSILETVTAAPDDLFEIGRAAIAAATAARPVRPLSPWAATAATVVSSTAAAPRAAAAILIAPGINTSL